MKKGFSNFIVLLLFAACIIKPLRAQVLNVSEVIQEQDQWCWSATSKCILDYYAGYSTKSQCAIADFTRTNATWHNYGSVNCCTDPSKGCNYANYTWGYKGSMEEILNVFGNIKSNNLNRTLSIAEIATEIKNGRPFYFFWEWYSGGAHALVGHGISDKDIYFMNPGKGYGYEIADYDWIEKDNSHFWNRAMTFCMARTPLWFLLIIQGYPKL